MPTPSDTQVDPVLQAYFTDASIPAATRQTAAGLLDSGKVTEDQAKQIIQQKYPGKYGDGSTVSTEPSTGEKAAAQPGLLNTTPNATVTPQTDISGGGILDAGGSTPTTTAIDTAAQVPAKTMPELAPITAGATKGAASTVLEGGKLVQDTLGGKSAAGDAIMNNTVQPALAPANAAEAFGKGAEQTAEFAIPGLGEEAGAAKVTTLGGKALELGTKIVKGAAEMGGVSALQQGELNGDVATNAALGGAFPVAGEALKVLGKAGAESAKFISSTLSGVPVDAINHALKNPDAVKAAITAAVKDGSEGAAQKIYNTAQDALQNIKDARATAYQDSLSKITADTSSTIHDLSTQGAKDAAQKAIEQFGGSVSKGVIDPAEMAITKSDAGKLQEMMNRINTWKDNTPLGINKLRRVVDSYVQDGLKLDSSAKQFNSMVSKVSDNLSEYVGTAHPAIAEMNATYRAESEVLNNIQSQLKTGSADPNTALRKLLNVFNPKSVVYRPIVEELGAKGGKDLMSDIAGLVMSKWTPEGLGKFLVGSEGGTAITAAALGHPGALATLPVTAAAASPRIVGETAVLAGKAANAAKNIPTAGVANVTRAVLAKKKS